MNAERRLLCIYPWLVMGGADKFNLDMITCLAARGWQITIATSLPAQHTWQTAFEQITPDIVDLCAEPPEERPARLLALITTHQIDTVLISHSTFAYTLLPYLRANAPSVTYLDYCHMVDPDSPTGGHPYISVTQSNLLDLQITSSEDLRQWMIQRGGNAERIAVCTTNIDPQDWNPAHYDRAALRQALGIPPDHMVALYAARLERQKQPMLAAQVMRAIVRQADNVTFLIAGNGTYSGYMQSFLRWNGLERQARMLGPVSNQRIRELLALSDVLFLPSQYEGISLAIYEAMAMGVVPISSDVGGQRELVTPECGLLLRRGPQEAEQYAAALLELSRNRERLAAMGQAARQRVHTHFRLDQMGTQIEHLITHAQEQRRPTIHQPAEVADQAATAAINSAHQDDDHYLWRQRNLTLRQRIALLYWKLVEHGAWWLVPLADRLRRS